MRYLILITIVLTNCYEISINEVKDCIAKNCDTENTNCMADSTCSSALSAFSACFTANQYNVTYPYAECKGVANSVYSSLMSCYEDCDYNLILHGMNLIIVYAIQYLLF